MRCQPTGQGPLNGDDPPVQPETLNSVTSVFALVTAVFANNRPPGVLGYGPHSRELGQPSHR